MIIIVEGIDRVGKTTLCNMLEKELRIPIYKHIGKRDFTKVQNDIETEKFFQVLEICKLSNSFIIFDRFHFSDYIYGSIERDYDKEKAKENFENLEEYMKNNLHDVILLLVLPTDIKRSSEEHGNDLSKHEEMFEQLFKESKIKNKYRVTYNTLNEGVIFVKSKISKSI